MSDAEPTLAELITMGVASGMQDVHVSMPGTVVSYDAATQTATIQPGIRRVIFDEDDEQIPETIPPFQNVPVMHYRCGAFSIHANLVAGDGVDLVFGSDSMAEWRQGKEQISTPGDLKRLGLSSPKAYPGLFPKNAPGADHDNSIGIPGGLRLHFEAGAIKVGNGSDFVAMSAKVDALFNAIKAAGATGAGAIAVVETGAAAFFTALATALGAVNTASSNSKAD
jgi:hypothetical protein